MSFYEIPTQFLNITREHRKLIGVKTTSLWKNYISVCMYGHTYSKSIDQPGKVANPARGQLNRENSRALLGKITTVKYRGIFRGNWWFVRYREK